MAHRAILGHFGPILGVLGAFSGNLGLLDAILDQYAAAGTSPPNVEILAFLASFRAILAVFWAVFAPLGPFGPSWSLFDPLSMVVSSPLVASSRVRSDLVSGGRYTMQ